MKNKFLFLEFLDPEINSLIFGLRNEFGYKGSSGVHITVRGPYSKSLGQKKLSEFFLELNGDPILIFSSGIFKNRTSVVYLKIKCDGLERIWNKPDFPKSKFGFNPHITVYEGSYKVAERVHRFLKDEQLNLLCRNYQLTEYVSKQVELFPYDELPRSRHFLKLANLRLVRADILQRAANLMKDVNRL